MSLRLVRLARGGKEQVRTAKVANGGRHALPDPVGKLLSVRHGGGEQYDADVFGKHDDDFLPHHAALGKERLDQGPSTRSTSDAGIPTSRSFT